MNNNPEGGLELVVSAGPTPEELKNPVEESELNIIINYDKKVYAIKYNALRNLGLDHYNDIVRLCQKRGLIDPAFFSRACIYCNNSTTNIMDLVEISTKPFVLETIPKVNCTYKPDKKIRIASAFASKERNQAPFYAVRREERCAFEDSLILYLADNGYLDSYRVNLDFNFVSISSFEPGDKIPEEYLVENIQRKLVFSKKSENTM